MQVYWSENFNLFLGVANPNPSDLWSRFISLHPNKILPALSICIEIVVAVFLELGIDTDAAE
jgi:hypothetical protein